LVDLYCYKGEKHGSDTRTNFSVGMTSNLTGTK